MKNPTAAPLTAPLRTALAAISPEPFIQHSVYLLFVQKPETLAPDVHRALTAAVDDSLAEMGAA